MAEDPVKRQTAVKIRISDIKNSRYIKTEGEWEPNYLLTPYETKVSRVNLLGTVIDSDNNSFNIDDGTGQIIIRSFEELSKNQEIGNLVIVIGKPREFNEIYVAPEIIKKIENKQKEWVELRKLELEKLYASTPQVEMPSKTESLSGIETKNNETEAAQQQETKTQQKEAHNEPLEEIQEPEPAETPGQESKTFDTILNTIKQLDDGNGADIENIISSSGLSEHEVENVVNNLLVDGEAFEIKPGRLKLLD